ncbi:DNA binding domain protein, excisionase family [uncultured Desulfobacterium sp.]|uniref:DNA binding domain protein, excisionase family n=1 Tax=uncultured Desulfobacterium sp. TaxID=201089 RepID=A0A445MXU5_9BACT|nr:DNA binding domain protein, excisionase family [uncultured Desulfobacterium sp.]
MEGWTKKKGGANYAGVGERTFHDFLRMGLRHVKLPSGTVLIRYLDIDEFLEHYIVDKNEVSDIVNQVLGGMS